MKPGSLFLLIIIAIGCGPNDENPRRRRATRPADRTDRSLPMNIPRTFDVPASWEQVKLPSGVEFRQPSGFTIVNAPTVSCDSNTPPADLAVLQTSLADRWPLTLAMRRGDLSRIARANGFTIDSTDIAAHDQDPDDSTSVRRGEGWMLLAGRSGSLPVLFASVRAPEGCFLVWAARGMEIDADTLGYVLGTVKFGAPERN